ncbi:MAG: hypothetical protein HYR88_07040 [Verrucomicrobia bacterium]|nr:hypothetical protein [Verrucomicrobiota bacterium]MBI3869582.1 hypothetical protein [Verrucomicrobiota bacterium]
MKRLLHVLTRPDDALALDIIAQHEGTPGIEVRVVRLDQESPDYRGLVELVFESDSVQVW